MGERSWMHDDDPLPVSRTDRILSSNPLGNTRTFRYVLAAIIVIGVASIAAAML